MLFWIMRSVLCSSGKFPIHTRFTGKSHPICIFFAHVVVESIAIVRLWQIIFRILFTVLKLSKWNFTTKKIYGTNTHVLHLHSWKTHYSRKFQLQSAFVKTKKNTKIPTVWWKYCSKASLLRSLFSSSPFSFSLLFFSVTLRRITLIKSNISFKHIHHST